MTQQAVFNDDRAAIVEQLNTAFSTLKDNYSKTPYPSYNERRRVLLALKRALIDNEKALIAAMSQDYGYRSDFDSLLSDILPSVSLINYTLKRLAKWMKPSKRHAGLLLMPSSVRVHYQPLGVVGVITPWNFPLYLALGPTIQAIAAGNRVMIKMSEDTPETTQLLKTVLAGVADYIHIVDGVKGAGSLFSKLPFDHLIFTGSTGVGKLVAKAAADNLTPITLELGGKSPTIIAADADINAAVDAVILGKSINSGQICVAPDYIFVHQSREKEFVDLFLKRYRAYHIQSTDSNSQTHIINEKQLKKLHGYIENARDLGASVHAVSSEKSRDKKLMYPHVLTNVSEEMTVMQDEIFGSVLPIMTYQAIDDVIAYINARPRPLALYLMTKNKALIDKVIKQTHSGGVAVNDTTMHVMADDAPFGGVGNSGLGQYHGHEGFLTFSKAKTVLRSTSWFPKNRLILQHRDLVYLLAKRYVLR